MRSALKAEFTKLLTVRSTYILTLIVLVIMAAIPFYVGIHDTPLKLHDPTLMQSAIFGALRFAGLITAIISILLLAHEYRYNTINFSFTLNRSRTSVLASKAVVMTVYSVIIGLVTVGIVVAFLHLGASLHGQHIGPQHYSVLSASNGPWPGLLLQSVFYTWGLAIAGLIITALLRNLVASIAFIFIFPTLEDLVTLISKTVVNYLPFTDLGAVLKMVPAEAGFGPGKSMIIFLIYLAVFAVLAWRLILKRDAN